MHLVVKGVGWNRFHFLLIAELLSGRCAQWTPLHCALYAGGQYRVCLLQGEKELLPDSMRPSGDIGYVSDNGRLYCVGRTDRQIKRSGHRINLDSVQQVITVSMYGSIVLPVKCV